MEVTNPLKIETYYRALVDRDNAYTGIFYVGVKTTSVFCIATCRARKPKKENVVFYEDFKSALQNGYRPCKICKPTENAQTTPLEIEKAIQMVKNNPKSKVTNHDLINQGISPDKVRRWFKQHYNLTYHAFQRMYRINEAYKELKEGKITTHTAFDNGYESLSGFGYTYKKITGNPPSLFNHTTVLLLHRLTTPLGPMFICASDNGICLLEFVDRKMLETEFKDLQRLLNAPILVGTNQHIQQASKQLQEYFSGTRSTFSCALDLPGTAFQKKVWQGLQQIPYGQTSSYQKQAAALGQPNAYRAVASANGNNRVSIMVPCHRVIGKDGALKGYGGGIERKKWLLTLENKKKN